VTCVFSVGKASKWSLKNSAWKPAPVVSRFVRKVRTASGAVAVQIVTRRGRQVERVEHVGSAHSDGELALLLASARERLAPGQDVLDLGEVPVSPVRLDQVADWTSQPRGPAGQQALEGMDPATAPRRGRRRGAGATGQVVATAALLLWQVLTDAYRRLGFDALADEAFRAMVLARIVEPTRRMLPSIAYRSCVCSRDSRSAIDRDRTRM